MAEGEDPYQLKEFSLYRLVGGNVASVPIVFSTDNSQAFFVDGSAVILVNVSTGNWEHVLSHSSQNTYPHVIGVHFEAPNKLITFTDDGIRSVWNTENGTVISIDNPDTKRLEIFLSYHNSDSSDIMICKKAGKLNVFEYKESSTRLLFSTRQHDVRENRQTAIADDFVVVCDKRSVFVYSIPTGKCKNFTYFGKMGSVTVEQTYFVSVAACKDTIAASMHLGRVFMWDDVSKNNMRTATRTVHWHQTAPNLVVTPYGSLVSGGNEATLVKYSLNETKQTLTPSFLPHFQANIVKLGLSNDGSLLSVVLEDNSVHFVLLSTMTVLLSPKTLQTRLKNLPQSFLPLLSDPCHPNSVIVSAFPGKLHWIDVSSGLTFDSLDVTGENVLARNSKEVMVNYCDIVSAEFSVSLAVISVSRLHSEIPMNRLKFWSRFQKTGALHLDFERDCGDISVTFIRICDSNSVLTIDSKGCLSCWKRDRDSSNKWLQGKNISFQNTLVCHASQFKNSKIASIHTNTAVEDADRGGVLVIWDISTGDIPIVQQCYRADYNFRSVEWDPTASSSVLFLSAPTYVCAYNFISSSVVWIICNLSSPKIGITSNYFFFSMVDGVYVYKTATNFLSDPVKIAGSNFRVQSSLALNRGSDFKIVFAVNKGFMVLSKTVPNFHQEQRSDNKKRTAFGRLVFSAQQKSSKQLLTEEKKSPIDMLAGPTHALPPVPLLAPRFIEACLAPPKIS